MKTEQPISKGQTFLHQVQYALLLMKQKQVWGNTVKSERKQTGNSKAACSQPIRSGQIYVSIYSLNLIIFPFLFFPLSLHFHIFDLCPLLVGYLHAAFLFTAFICLSLLYLFSLISGWCNAPDKESFVLSKTVGLFLFTYGSLKILLYNFYH